MDTDFGTSYGAYRPAEEDSYYWRIGPLPLPLLRHAPRRPTGPRRQASTPTCRWTTRTRCSGRSSSRTDGTDAPLSASCRSTAPASPGQRPRRHATCRRPPDWLGRFNIEQNLENDYLIDREAQNNWESYTGIPGIRQQDMAVTESMGPIYDRAQSTWAPPTR